MKKTYASPRLFQYGDFADVVQYRIFKRNSWDFVTKRRYWFPWQY